MRFRRNIEKMWQSFIIRLVISALINNCNNPIYILGVIKYHPVINKVWEVIQI